MWHEARRQERKIRGMLVDYRRRAERRRDFYEKIKADPTQFLQLHGRQCKIHLDPAVAAAADSPAAMMPWQNQPDNLIDRFDVRAHLDFIPPIKKEMEEELNYEERQLNYERYRIVAQNSFLNISEEKFLKQLHLEEQFGYTESEPKKKKSTGAAIGFNYEDGSSGSGSMQQSEVNDNASDGNSDSDLDVDLSINISKIDQVQAHDLNRHGRNFGMSTNDFYSFLTNDLEEAECWRLAREEEHEKALFSGRKSRRERRAHREKRLANRVISPPSYAARTSPTYPSFRESKSASRSPSPEVTEKITYITSFGDEEEPTTSKPTYADKVKHGSKSIKKSSSTERTISYIGRNKTSTKDRDRSYRKRGRSRSKSRNRSSRSPKFRRRSRSRSGDRSRARRSRSSSRNRYRNRSSNSMDKNKKHRRSSSATSVSSSSSDSVQCSSSSSSSSSTKSSSSASHHKNTDSSRSRSVSTKQESPPKVVSVPRYYGRKRSDQSSSESESEEENSNKSELNPIVNDKYASSGNSGNSIKKTGSNLSLQERLKRKRQALLNKQFKADKKAEQLKTEREKQEQQHREDELREMAIKLRRRQREIRHAYDTNSSASSGSDGEERDSPLVATVPNRPASRSPSPRLKRESHSRGKERDRESKRDRNRDRERDRRDNSTSPREDSDKRATAYRDEDGKSANDYEKRDSRDRSSKKISYSNSVKALVDY